jgi:predicted O-methyltransferase YrrM
VTAPRFPERLAVAVDLVDVLPGQRILEIGGGRGIAARLVCDRLGDGRYVGIDRSAKAVAAARELNSAYVERGIAQFRQLARVIEPCLDAAGFTASVAAHPAGADQVLAFTATLS